MCTADRSENHRGWASSEAARAVSWASPSAHPLAPTKQGACWALEHREVVAGLGLGTEGHLAAVSSYDAAQKAFGLLAKAFPSPSARLPPGIILFAVPPQAYLAHNTLKQCLDIVMQCC